AGTEQQRSQDADCHQFGRAEIGRAQSSRGGRTIHRLQCANNACRNHGTKRRRHYCELFIFSGKMEVMTTANTWTDLLRERHLRVTRQRLAVLDAIAEHPHLSAEAVHSAVVRQLPEITVQSVYTVLHDLTANQLLRRFDPPGSAARYEARTDDNHHHAICTVCGRIEDVDCA